MNFPLKAKLSSQVWWSLVFSSLAFIILYISLVRASLNIMTKDNNESKLRVMPIEFTVNREDGPEKCVYKLPEVTTLPNNPMYLFKQMRDYLWVELSHDPTEKSEVLLLLADKKMTEAISLYKNNNIDLALATSEEAINKLKYADKAILENKVKTVQTQEIEKQIIKAGCAYGEALKTINKDGRLDENKYKKIISELEKWNEEKQKTN
jgi:hypothetical protein